MSIIFYFSTNKKERVETFQPQDPLALFAALH